MRTSLVAMDVDLHVKEVAEQGYTIVEDAIEPGSDRRAERFAVAPRTLPRGAAVAQLVRGHEHAAHLQPARLRRRLAARPRARARAPDRRAACSIRGCLISSLSSIDILPGEIAQPIHADDQLIPLPKPHPPTVCNSMWALTDFTEANGATRLIPGTHLSDHSPDYGARLRLDRGRDAEGLGARSGTGASGTAAARTPPSERARRHRDELLRGLHPPAGEPAARPAPREGRRRSSRGCASSSATACTTC